MKPEQLKGKLQRDNRSAVKGLLEKIKKKKAEVFEAAKEVGETSFHKGMIQGLLTAEEIIKKWFPDVFKERDEDVQD